MKLLLMTNILKVVLVRNPSCTFEAAHDHGECHCNALRRWFFVRVFRQRPSSCKGEGQLVKSF